MVDGRTLVLLLAATLIPPTAAAVSDGPDNNVTTITAADIRREKPVDLMALLRSRVGLDDSGGTITMRGVQGVVIHIDGFSASLTELKQLKPEQVETIAIMRGAASARYGADAMGGAIVVTTHRRYAASSSVDLIQGYNSSDSRYTRLIGTRQDGPWSLSLLGEESRTHGYKRVTESPYAYQITVEDERSRKRTIDAKLGYQGEGIESILNLKHFRLESFYGRPNWWEEYATSTARLVTTLKRSPETQYQLSVGYERYTDEGLRDRGTGTDAEGLAPDRRLISKGHQYEGELSMEMLHGQDKLRLGACASLNADSYAIRDYAGDATTFLLDAKIANAAAFALYQMPMPNGVDVELSGRYDHYRYFDTEIYNRDSDVQRLRGEELTKAAFNPKLGVRWAAGGQTLFTTSVGTGFIPPLPDQLYYADINESARFLANPALKPQRSLTWDLGAVHTIGEAQLGVTLFYTQWRNKIGVMIIDYGTPLTRQFQNIGEAESKGIELEIDRPIDEHWSLLLNYTYNRAEITENRADPALVGNVLPDMPRHKGNLGVNYEGPNGLTGRALLRYVGESYTDERNTVVDEHGHRWLKDDYVVVDLSLGKRLGNVGLTLAVDNLLDERYVTGFFWRNEGRVIRGEVAVRF